VKRIDSFDKNTESKRKMEKTIYLIPGVGADFRIFKNLHFSENCEVVHLKWVENKQGESVQSYAKRLLPQIKKDTIPVLIGMSFGGIIAIELSKLIKPAKTILISSIRNKTERPLKFSLLRRFPLHRFIPGTVVAKVNFWWSWALGDLTRKDKQMISEMIEDIDIAFNEWAAHQAISWQNEHEPDNLVQIHGTKDTIFPHIYISKEAHIIKGGTHWMVVNRAKEISNIIRKELAEQKIIKRIEGVQKAA
jgi:pimeloyl-ACP methyl ester carboxylesterase